MVSATLWTLASVTAISALSLVGALGLSFGILQRHRVMMFFVALAAGTLLGDTFLHLLPEAAATGGFDTRLATWVLGGFTVMFVLEVVLRWRHAHAEHVHEAHEHHVHSDHREPTIAPFGWLNLLGDALHNLLDGVVIAAAFLVEPAVGFATTIAVALHEIPQELGDFAVLVRSGMAPKKALLLNLGSALFALLGAGLVLAAGWSQEALESVALPLVAGGFLYIAAADLVPELHHHSKGRDAWLILLGVLLGFVVMFALLGLEDLSLFQSDA